MNFKSSHGPMVGINPASMSDIVLLLLIFFMLSSSFVIQPGIQVKLPKAQTTEVQSERNIIITIKGNGDIFLNQGKTDFNDLAVSLLHELSKGDDDTIILRADKEVSIQQLVKIMDIAKSVGSTKFLIATQERDK